MPPPLFWQVDMPLVLGIGTWQHHGTSGHLMWAELVMIVIGVMHCDMEKCGRMYTCIVKEGVRERGRRGGDEDEGRKWARIEH